MRKTLIAFISGVALLGSATVSLAQPDMEQVHQSAGVMAHFSEQLGLTEQQEMDIATVFEEAHVATAQDKTRLDELRDTLRALTEDFDDEQALEISEEIGDISGHLAYQRALTRSEAQSILTDEQQLLLETIRSEREERKSRRSNHRHGGSAGA